MLRPGWNWVRGVIDEFPSWTFSCFYPWFRKGYGNVLASLFFLRGFFFFSLVKSLYSFLSLSVMWMLSFGLYLNKDAIDLE